MTEEIRRRDLDNRSKSDQAQKNIALLKKDVENFKAQLKNSTIELGEHEATLLELKRHLAKRNTEL